MPPDYVRLLITPLELKEANRFVALVHRHHFPVIQHRFSFGVVDVEGELHGVCIVGRPVGRSDRRKVAEVTRLATDGTPNACSMLYAAAARACKALGYEVVQTYILGTEPGTSLIAAGWSFDGQANRSTWHLYRPGRRTDQSQERKGRWSLRLNPERPMVREMERDDSQTAFWDETEPAA